MSMECADGLDGACDRRRGVKDVPKFGLSNWTNDTAIYREAQCARTPLIYSAVY